MAHACDVSTGETETVDPWGSQHHTNLLGESRASDRPCLENKVDGTGAGYLGLTFDLYPHTIPTHPQRYRRRQTDRQTHRDRQTDTHTQADRQTNTNRQADTHTHRDRQAHR